MAQPSTWLNNELTRLRDDPIILGSSPNDLMWESQQNWRCIEQFPTGIREVVLDELRMIVDGLVEHWSKEMNTRYPGRRARCYLWFDEQSGLLCFGLVSAWHTTLPFRAALHLCSDPNLILTRFLDNPYVSGIPLNEFELAPPSEAFGKPEPEGTYQLPVYAIDIPL